MDQPSDTNIFDHTGDPVSPSDLDDLTQSFSGSLLIDRASNQHATAAAKRSYSDNAWDKASPVPKKIDVEDTPVFCRTVEPSSEQPEHVQHAELTSSLCTPAKSEQSAAKSAQSSVYKIKPYSNKLLVVGSVSAEHNTGDSHQENSQRTGLLCGDHGCLKRKELDGAIDWIDADTLSHPPLADLLRVHEYPYLAHLERKIAAQKLSASAMLPGYPTFQPPASMLDADTPLAPQSLSAAKKFCSAAMLAVDAVMQSSSRDRDRGSMASINSPGSIGAVDIGGYERAFIIGRPPGHHAGPNGCVVSNTFWRHPSMSSSGFCLLNSVAVAAAYARYRYGRERPEQPPRIAIVDIDIHHGNGTEEIVRNLRPHTIHLPLPASWAPESRTSYKPWLNEQDADEVFFASVHRFEGVDFYPGTGDEQLNDPAENIVNICLTALPPKAAAGMGREGKRKVKKQEELIKMASDEFRAKISSMLLPRLETFRPELLLISAGLDAHYDDAYHFLSEEDLHWVTQQLCDVVDRAGGRGVVSVLEGGYSLSSEAVSSPAPAQPAAQAPVAAAAAAGTGAAAGGMSLRNKAGRTNVASCKMEPSVQSPSAMQDNRFALRPRDGGLVKGVMAHVAALSRRDRW